MNQIGKYELQALVGKGASGSVFRARDTFTNTEVAVKVIDPESFRDPQFGEIMRNQFLNEASLAGKLSHPHIVAILDAVVEEGSAYIAMEYVSGGNLSEYAKPGRLMSINDAIQVGFKCCGALDYAFRQGIVHRDIKPANIMVSTGTDVKIADFGAAYLSSREVKQTFTIGSPAYVSPEQITGQPLTHHSDMFSLGVVLYELLTGHRPFTGPTVNDVVTSIVHEEPRAPGTYRPGLPPALERIVLTALRKNPEDRFPTWADMALQLADVGQLGGQQKTVPDSEKYEAMRKLEFFRQFADADIWQLVRTCSWRRVSARTVVLQEGDPGQSLLFLVKGQVKVTKNGRLLNLLRDGECIGEMSYVRKGATPRHATVEAMTDLLVAELDSRSAEGMNDHSRLRLTDALLVSLADRLSLADIRMAQM